MSTAAVNWWNESFSHVGMQSMEKLLSPDAGWEAVLASGEADLRPAFERVRMRSGTDLSVLDVGCGVGRLSQNLAKHFGRVVGIDISTKMLEQARQFNTNPAVEFELCDGERIDPQCCREFDTVFSYEVLYYVEQNVLETYFRDVGRLLKPGGEFVFQMNFNPLTWRTRLSYRVRDVLFACGVKQWRGWPTSPGFRRMGFRREWIEQQLALAGLQVERVWDERINQTWILARKR